ncbi:general secretion pathway protein GspM [Alcanivorax sp. N3-2A]|nr:general secretion pathway protein GspM [Alcanivorax sp. N3-2A]|tara:strand:- start:6214 stop:6741 length:528 start_codon:yes stop_codon:yes gene_type:complete
MNKQIEETRLKLRKQMAPAISWYQQREPREQRTLQLLAVLIGAALIYWLIWQPSWQARQDARQRYLANQETLSWIENNAPAVRAARGGSDKNVSDTLGANWVSEISGSVQTYGLTLRGFTPNGDRSVRIQMEDQPASQMLLWLHSLEQQGVALDTLEMSAGNQPGTASLRASLSR